MASMIDWSYLLTLGAVGLVILSVQVALELTNRRTNENRLPHARTPWSQVIIEWSGCMIVIAVLSSAIRVVLKFACSTCG